MRDSFFCEILGTPQVLTCKKVTGPTLVHSHNGEPFSYKIQEIRGKDLQDILVKKTTTTRYKEDVQCVAFYETKKNMNMSKKLLRLRNKFRVGDVAQQRENACLVVNPQHHTNWWIEVGR